MREYGTDGTSDGTKIRTRRSSTTQTTDTQVHYVHGSQGRRLSALAPATPTNQPAAFTRHCDDRADNPLSAPRPTCMISYGYYDASSSSP
ncbi:hypothetical protein ACF1E9_14860 [Streptomyces roseolus]|uniref:hypothetical protein n=1 Tax=Streptomyces roseolus TaxID=67358 RepID=UPI0037023E3F